jgi:beta-galactosidase
MNLSGIWDFTYTEETPGIIDIPSEFNGKISLPGCWDDFPDAFADYAVKINEEYEEVDFANHGSAPPDASLPFICGTVWYRKKINVAVKHQYAVLRLGRVTMDVAVFLNGQLVDCHIGYSTGFEVVLPGMPRGVNDLLIAVSNTRRDRLGCLVRGFKGYSGGVFGDAELQMYNAPSVKNLFIYPDEKLGKLNWEAELHVNQDDLILNAKIFKDGELIDEINSPSLKFQSNAKKLTPWSDDAPELYQIEVRLLHGDKVLDTFKRDFGMRRLTTEKMNLKINGVPVFLRGNTEHAYFAETCTAPTDKSYYLKVVSKMKELGFNWLRFHTSVPPEEYMQACDELGMFVQVEAPLGFGMQEWCDIVRACRHHPSVVIYCGGNEELLNEEKISYLETVAEKTKTLAPDALFNPQEALRGVEYSWNFSDFSFPVKREPFVHNPARLQHLQSFSDVFGQFPWGQLSYTSTCCDAKNLNHKLKYYEQPCLSHEVCIQGTYLDLSLESRYKNTRIGDRIYNRVRQNMIDAGLLDNAELYYQNSCRWQQVLRKQTLENARSCSNLAGYDLLGAIDYQWHRYGYPCGVMNEFYELKPGENIDNVLAYNGRSVLLLDKDNKHCYRNTDKLKFKVLFSCFEPEGTKTCKLEVKLTDDNGGGIEHKYVDVEGVDCGNIAELGNFEFSFPALTTAKQYFIQVSFAGFENKWSVWSFPDIAPRESKVIETDYLDDTVINKISEGANCILYGKGPFPAIGTTWQLSVAGRAEGNLATVIYNHPVFKDFPHENWCDWHFSDMIENADAVDLSILNLPVSPVIEMVSSFKKIKRQAMLFELKIGTGHLIVCTLNLNNSPIAGSYLKHQLQGYAKNLEDGQIHTENAFVVEPSLLRKIINHKYSYQSILPTDQGFDALGQLKV